MGRNYTGIKMASVYSGILVAKRDRLSIMPTRTLAVEAESDRGRLVFSAPFRRLQQKAQVFSLESNAAVRSRLTHSIEVAQIGRFIADQIVEKLLPRGVFDISQARAFVTFVEVACLMHDLGNPPFGHFGEAAISEWFKANGKSLISQSVSTKPTKQECENALADFAEFDGNCQGLRVATILQWTSDAHGLNLTYTSLAAYLKYCRGPVYAPSTKLKARRFQKKAGYFSTERDLVFRMWKYLGINPTKPRRFPLAYVMEAADDIAYCISDLEDAIEKKLIVQKTVFKELQSLWRVKRTAPYVTGRAARQITTILHAAASSDPNSQGAFTAFRTGISRVLSEEASQAYLKNHNDILVGNWDSLIRAESTGGELLSMLKEYCRENIYGQISVQRVELAGLSAIRGLLEHFQCLLSCSRSRFTSALDQKTSDQKGNRILSERKLLSLFPEKHKIAYRHAALQLDQRPISERQKELEEWNLRAHLVTDFIGGMTDDFALWSFQMLSGIRTE